MTRSSPLKIDVDGDAGSCDTNNEKVTGMSRTTSPLDDICDIFLKDGEDLGSTWAPPIPLADTAVQDHNEDIHKMVRHGSFLSWELAAQEAAVIDGLLPATGLPVAPMSKGAANGSGDNHKDNNGGSGAMEPDSDNDNGVVAHPDIAPVRRGKWTIEEEAFSDRLILEFKKGTLPLTEGTTLRTFLSKVLNCEPMRISKKFVGPNSIGKV